MVCSQKLRCHTVLPGVLRRRLIRFVTEDLRPIINDPIVFEPGPDKPLSCSIWSVFDVGAFGQTPLHWLNNYIYSIFEQLKIST